MSRYIEVDKLCNKVIEAEDYYSKLDNFESQTKYEFLLNVITPMIVSTPSEDVAPVVHAHWIDSKGLYQCSACKHIWSELWWTSACPIDRMNKMMHYCPNCGAKMDKIEQDEYAYAESLYEQEMQKQFLEMSDPNTGAL